MAPPVTRETALRRALAAYLQAEMLAIDTALTSVDWLYYNNTIAPEDGPKGSIWLRRITMPQYAIANSREAYAPPERDLQLQLLIADADVDTAMSLSESWLWYLAIAPDSICNRLSRIGLAAGTTQDGFNVAGAFAGLGRGQWSISLEASQYPGAIARIMGNLSFMDGE